MDTRRADAAQGADGPRKLALDRSPQIDVRQKVAGGEGIGTIEQLVADGSADRHAFLGQRHAQAQGIAARYHDRIAAWAQPVGHAHGLKPADQLLRVGQGQAGEQEGIGIVGGPPDDVGEEAQQRTGDEPKRDDPASAQGLGQLKPWRSKSAGRPLRRLATAALDDRRPLLHALQPRPKLCSGGATVGAAG